MNEQTGETITWVAAFAAFVTVIFFLGSCMNQKYKTDAETERVKQEALIKAGYEWKLVPGKLEPMWVKPQ